MFGKKRKMTDDRAEKAAEKAAKKGDVAVTMVWQAMLLLEDYGLIEYNDMRKFDEKVRTIRAENAR